MLKIIVQGPESFDEVKQEFVENTVAVLELEHSLFSLSKWESKWEIPFLSEKEKTDEQSLDYIRCMLLHDTSEEILSQLNQDNLLSINDYINTKQTATWFAEGKKSSGGREVVTAEIMYHWMVALQIPVEFDKWHLNRLVTLVKVCNEKNQPEKKMSKSDAAAQRAKLNAERKAQMNSQG